jgi:hypothetical protein
MTYSPRQAGVLAWNFGQTDFSSHLIDGVQAGSIPLFMLQNHHDEAHFGSLSLYHPIMLSLLDAWI